MHGNIDGYLRDLVLWSANNVFPYVYFRGSSILCLPSSSLFVGHFRLAVSAKTSWFLSIPYVCLQFCVFRPALSQFGKLRHLQREVQMGRICIAETGHTAIATQVSQKA